MAITRFSSYSKSTVCKFWLNGNCKFGINCKFLHPENKSLPAATKRIAAVNSPTAVIKKASRATKRIAPIITATEKKSVPVAAPIKREIPTTTVAAMQTLKLCPTEKQAPGEFFSGPFFNLANLRGHTKEVTGIVLPTGSDKLYTASRDGTMRVWNCNSGECVSVRNLGGEIGCLISEGSWVIASLPNLIKAWNILNESSEEPICLKHSFGQVHAMEADEDLLFFGTQEGTILAWKGDASSSNPFKLEASLKGHSRGVLCMAIGRGKLYSGSMDKTIRVWDMKTFQCLHELKGHSGHVTSLICWENVLISSSLDKNLMSWGYDEGQLVMLDSRQEENGIVRISGMNKADSGLDNDVMFCSLKDNSVRLYDLQPFAEKGKICRKQEIKAIKTGPGNLFFTGDGTGSVSVWNWASNNGAVAA